MQGYLKKYFWVLNVLVVVVCASFAAMATNNYLEAKYLGDSASAPKQATPRPRPPRKPPVERSKDGKLLADRNMFCSTCTPPEPEPVDDGPIDNSGRPPNTSLPLELIATNVSRQESLSFATIHNRDKATVGAYRVGDEIPDAGPVKTIRGKYVDFENKSSRRVERISLDAHVPDAPRRETPTVARAPRDQRDDLNAELDEGIKKVNDNNYEIDRALVEKIIANPAAIRGARIVPSIKNGQPNGFKLYAIRPSSAFAKIGLQNGDTIHAINGFDLTTPDKALEVYTKVREANSLSVSITRRGKPVQMNYTIR